MKKTLKTLVLSLLTTNLLVGTLSTIVRAEDTGGDTGEQIEPPSQVEPPTEPEQPVNPPVEPPVESETPVESELPEESEEPSEEESEESSQESSEEESSVEESSGESSEESTVTPPPVVPSYPEYPSGTYTPPRTESRTPVTSAETSSDETTVASEFESSANLDNLTNLLASSLNDENFALAWEDYQLIIKEYELLDIKAEGATSSTITEILDTFEGHATPEEVTTEDGQKTLVFSYVAENPAEDSTPAQIILYFNESDFLVGSALLQASDAQFSGSPLTAELFQGLFLRQNSELYAEELFVTALYQVLSNDVTYTTFATPSVEEGSDELVIIDNQFVLNHVTTEESETPLIGKLQQLAGIFIDSLEDTSLTDSEEVSSDEDETGESEIVEEEKEVNEFIQRFAPANYDDESVSTFDQLSSSYQELTTRIEDSILTLTDEEIKELLGEPATQTEGGASIYYSYYSIEDERIVLFDLQVDKNSNVVTTMKYDYRTPTLDDEFPISIEELFVLAKEDLSMSNLVSTLGEPNIIEHIFAGGHQIRNVWTSYTDPEMGNVEAYEETNTGKVELYYYDQD